MVRNRTRIIELSERELNDLIAANRGRCAYCHVGISIDNCIVEESNSVQRLRKELRDYRTEKARQEELPRYTVFTDKALESLVSQRPLDVARLQFVYGIAEAKTAKYGSDIVAIIAKDDQRHPQDNWEHRPTCQDCARSVKKAIRIPKGQVDAIESRGVNFTEFVRMAISKSLEMDEEMEELDITSEKNPGPWSPIAGLVPGDTYHIARDSDGRRVSDSFRMGR